jgi:hypothetical protein
MAALTNGIYNHLLRNNISSKELKGFAEYLGDVKTSYW